MRAEAKPRPERPEAGRRSLRLVLVAATIAMAAATSAPAFFEPVERRGDLDGDAGIERAFTAPRPVRGEEWTEVRVSDDCPAATATNRRISGVEESLGRLRLVAADTRPGREVFLDLRSGASGRNGETRLVAWRPTAGCPAPRRLFAYRPERSSRPPRGALRGAANFGAVVRDVERRFAGREVILDELYVTRRVPAGCCPSFRKRRYFRYDPRSDRYRRYRTRVTRLPTR